MRELLSGRWTMSVVAWGVLAVWLLGVWIGVDNAFYFRILIIAGLYATVVVPLDLLMGYMGYLPFGQAAFFGLGAYTVGNLTTLQFELNYWLALFISVLLVGVVGYLVSVPLFRLTGAHFAIGTLVLGQLAFIVFNSWSWFSGGPFGIVGIQRPAIGGFAFDTNSRFYLLVALAFFLVALGSWLLTRGSTGLAMHAIRQDEVLAQARGLDITRVRRLIFTYAALCAGMAGALFAPLQVAIAPAQFTVQLSLLFIIVTILGGTRTLVGPALGATAFIILEQMVQTFAEWNQLVLGLLLVLVVLFFKAGIWGAVRLGSLWVQRQLGRGPREPMPAELPSQSTPSRASPSE